MKTIKDWLNTIADDEIREKALKYCLHDDVTEPESLSDAIKCAFDWLGSPEGLFYWVKISDQAATGKLEIISENKMQREDWNDIANGRNGDSDYKTWASPDKPCK